MGHFPAGTSSKLAVHFAQFILKGENRGVYLRGAVIVHSDVSCDIEQ